MIALYLFFSYASFVIHFASIPFYMILTPALLLIYRNNKFNKNIFLLCALFIWPIIYTFFLSISNRHSIDVSVEVLAYIIHALSFILVSSFIYSNYTNYLKAIENLLLIIFITLICDVISGAIFGKPIISFMPTLEDIFTGRRDNIIPILGLQLPRIQGFMSEATTLGLAFNSLLFILVVSNRYKPYHLILLFIVQISTLSISSIPLTLINLVLIFKKIRSIGGFIFLFLLVISISILFYLLGDLVNLVNAAISKLSGQGASGIGRLSKLLLLIEMLKESMFLGYGIDYFVSINGTNTGTYLGLFLIEGGLVSLGFLIITFFIMGKISYQTNGLVETILALLFILFTLFVHSSAFPLIYFLPMIHLLSINNRAIT